MNEYTTNDMQEDFRKLAMRTINLIQKTGNDELAHSYLYELANTHDQDLELLLQTLILETSCVLDKFEDEL